MTLAFDLRTDLVIYTSENHNYFKKDLEKLTKYNIDNYYIEAKVKLATLENFDGDIVYNLNIDLSENNLECTEFTNEIESFLLQCKALDVIMNSNLCLEPLINLKSESIIKIKVPKKLISNVEEKLNPLNVMRKLLLNKNSKIGKILLKNINYKERDSLDITSKSQLIIYSYILFGANILYKNQINYDKLESINLHDFGIRRVEDVEHLLNLTDIIVKEFEYSKLGKLFIYTDGKIDEIGLSNSIERHKNIIEQVDQILLRHKKKPKRETPSNMYLKKLHRAIS